MTVGNNAEGFHNAIFYGGNDGAGVSKIVTDSGNGCICVRSCECLLGAGS